MEGMIRVVAATRKERKRVLLELLQSRPEIDVREIVDNGVALVDAVRRFRPQVVLTTAIMPQLDGLGAIRAIRTMPGGEKTFIILITASFAVITVTTLTSYLPSFAESIGNDPLSSSLKELS